MDYQALKALIETHPSWPSVDDITLHAWVNEEVVSVDRPTLPASEVYATIVASEFSALTDPQKQDIRDILYIHSAEGVPTAPGSRA